MLERLFNIINLKSGYLAHIYQEIKAALKI